MKLDYKILWVDDRIGERQYQDMIERLSKYLADEEFFVPTIVQVENSEEFEQHFNKEYDLIITDFNLGEKNGDFIVSYTRSRGISTEIFFYSAKDQLPISNNFLFNSRITYYSMTDPNGYRELYGRIKALVEETVKKFHHIISMRGMVMAETSELDVLMKEILCNMLSPEKEKINESKTLIKTKFLEDNSKRDKAIIALNEIEEFLQLLRAVGANNIWRAVKRGCSGDLIKFKVGIGDYDKDVIGTRNILAHAKYFKKDDKEYLESFDPEGQPHNFDAAMCRGIRHNLNKYKLVLEELNGAIKESMK